MLSYPSSRRRLRRLFDLAMSGTLPLALVTASCGTVVETGRERVPVAVVHADGMPAAGQPYSGTSSCRPCHGPVFRFWSTTAHAGSLDSLLNDRSSRDPSCLRCHTTGYGERTGFASREASPDLGSVGCESCHGPASDHAGSAFPEIVPPAGECAGCDVSRVCRFCHTLSRSPDFEMSRYLPQVTCRAAYPGSGSGRDSGMPGGGDPAGD